tara:strand:+ start:163 stop:531 length:369 start_codon:yes stop_codon:yes gene_type:complete
MINQTDIEAFEYYNDMTIDISMTEYSEFAEKTAIYPEEAEIVYPALGLAGEAGEVANKVKKMIRDDRLDRDAIASELGDCLWYIAALCRDLNVDMASVARKNLDKLSMRKQKGTLQGNGDAR